MEAYLYAGCDGLADRPEALKNCDSFAIVARGKLKPRHLSTIPAWELW